MVFVRKWDRPNHPAGVHGPHMILHSSSRCRMRPDSPGWHETTSKEEAERLFPQHQPFDCTRCYPATNRPFPRRGRPPSSLNPPGSNPGSNIENKTMDKEDVSPWQVVLGILVGAVIVFMILTLIWDAIFNWDDLVNRFVLAYIELWGLAVLLLPVWVIWMILKSDK